jgi:hypothetical protein
MGLNLGALGSLDFADARKDQHLNSNCPNARHKWAIANVCPFAIISSLVSRHGRISIRAVCFVVFLLPSASRAGSAPPVNVNEAFTGPSVIVIGFVGGFVKHDDAIHGAVQVAARLREKYPSGVYVEALENHRREKAHAEIVRLMDTDRDGTLSVEEKQNARIIIYGHSWGGSETVTLARQLEKEGIPVLLTIQVDSVSKFGENDTVIPANVAQAANFYQPDGLVHGRRQIRAADPTRTHIIGNFRFDYKTNPIQCERYPWYDRLFVKSHTEIECDPRVWTQVESLIHSELSSETTLMTH